MSLLATPAILLRAYPYSETSRILRFYSESQGVLGAMARGIRKSGGKLGDSLSTFSEGILSVQFRENRDLQTYRNYSATRTRMGLAADPLRLSAASVLGELILRHAESEGNPVLFAALSSGLDALESEVMEGLVSTLLVHVWSLVGLLGFAPLIQECVVCSRAFQDDEMGRFDFAAGGLRCPACQGEIHGPRLGPGARAQLGAMMEGRSPEDFTRPKAHLRLVSDFITYHISGGTPLRSMSVLGTLIQDSDA